MLSRSSPLSSEVTKLLNLLAFTFPLALLFDFGVEVLVESLESGDFAFSFSFFLKKCLTFSRTSSYKK